jgi:hypothetical protein
MGRISNYRDKPVMAIDDNLYYWDDDTDSYLKAAQGPIIAPVSVPTGFRWTTPPITIKRMASGPVTDFDITSLIPAITITYYVDPINGSDANAGTSRGLPLLNLATALAKVDVDQIRIINLTADFIAKTTKSWNNTQPTRSLSVIVEGNFRYISCMCSSAVTPTWTVNGTFSNVYQATITSTNSASVVDVKNTVPLTYTDVNGKSNTVSYLKAYKTYTNVASLAAVAAAPGTWFNDGTNTYVNPIDGRNIIGDATMVLGANANNGRFPSVNNLTIYVQGVDFVGGRPWYSTMLSTVTGTTLAFNNCSFQGAATISGNNFNGLNIQAFQNVYSYRCGAFFNGSDGFNYHSQESDGTTPATSPSWIEIECVAMGNGTVGSTGGSDNASTCHDFCNGIRLNCIYINSDDRVVADTNSAHTWTLGGVVGQAVKTIAGNESIASIGTASKMWIDSVFASEGANPKWIATVGATLTYFNSGNVVNAGTGEAVGTIKSYLG